MRIQRKAPELSPKAMTSSKVSSTASGRPATRGSASPGPATTTDAIATMTKTGAAMTVTAEAATAHATGRGGARASGAACPGSRVTPRATRASATGATGAVMTLGATGIVAATLLMRLRS